MLDLLLVQMNKNFGSLRLGFFLLELLDFSIQGLLTILQFLYFLLQLLDLADRLVQLLIVSISAKSVPTDPRINERLELGSHQLAKLRLKLNAVVRVVFRHVLD